MAGRRRGKFTRKVLTPRPGPRHRPSLHPTVVSPPGSNLPKRTFWQKRLFDPIVLQLTQGITPEKIALTIAVGSALALFPLVGITTVLCFLAGVVLRLNQPMIQVVNYLCTPLHITAMYYSWQWGDRLFGEVRPRHHMREAAQLIWNLLWHDPAAFMHRFGLTILHATVIWAIAAPIWTCVLYFISRTTLREVARVRAESAAKALAASVRDSQHPIP